MDEQLLTKLFSPFGPVSDAFIIRDNNGVTKRCGLIKFENLEDAQKAINTLNETSLTVCFFFIFPFEINN